MFLTMTQSLTMIFFYFQDTLCVLRVDHNNIDHIRDLSVLKELRHFSAADNKLHSMGVSDVALGYPLATPVVFSHCGLCNTVHRGYHTGPSPFGSCGKNIVHL